ncbi:MAG: hypothetical protein R2706_15125 [Acidimicrobiales bacterium]
MTSTTPIDEEPWEHEIQQLLGSLPAVRPPEGFIAQALDHRPLFAGRIGLGLSVAAAGTLAACLTAGVFGPRHVVPELASMTKQHDVSTASIIGGLASSEPLVFEPVDPAVVSPITLPVIGAWRPNSLMPTSPRCSTPKVPMPCRCFPSPVSWRGTSSQPWADND